MEPGVLIRNLLTADATITALVGARIYPLAVPQDTPYPAVAYQLISRPRERCRAGILGSTARVQVSVFAAKYADVAALDAAIFAVLDGLTTEGGAYLEYDDSRDELDAPAKHYGRFIDYLVTQPD